MFFEKDGFLQETNAPSEEMAKLLPDAELSPDRDNTTFWFHDTMQMTMSGRMKPNGRGSGIVVAGLSRKEMAILHYLALCLTPFLK